MKIIFKEITVCDLVKGYADNGNDGVTGYGGELDIRPPYQREFVYKDAQRDAVIDTVFKGFPLNVMYWAVRDDEGYEIIDGQQRTISLCQYLKGDFSVKIGNTPQNRTFHNLQDDERDKLLDYKLMVYLCEGTDSEKLSWFKTINIAGEKLTDQELRNAVYHGSWVSDAKRYFSKANGPAYGVGKDYLSGSPIRQEYLETAIKWITHNGDIEAYMSKNQHDKNAEPLWKYFQAVIEWVKTTFTTYRKEMKSVDWGALYNRFKDKTHNPTALEKEIATLMADDDVINKKGIYPYVLTRQEKHLNTRSFPDSQKRTAYQKQNGICAKCAGKFKLDDMEADHIKPWHEGGKTIPENCQMLCKDCNRRKGGK